VRLGILTTSYPRHAGDPAGHFVAGLAGELVRRGADIELFAAGNAGERDGSGTPRVRRLRAPGTAERLFYAGGAPDRLEASRLLWIPAALFAARQLAAAAASVGRWDALLTHWLVPSGMNGALIACGRPHVAVAHSGDVGLLRRIGLLGPLLALLAHRKSQLAFVSKALREQVRAWLPSPPSPPLERLLDEAVIAPMGVDAEAVVPAARVPEVRREERRALGLPEDRFLALVLARLEPIKGVDVAVAAARRAGVSLVVAGDGSERRRLEGLAAAAPLIRLVGSVDRSRASRLLAASDLLVVPSRVLASGRTEGAPTVVGEAYLAGVPVVASAVGGLPELVSHGVTGILVPPDDVVALAAILGELAQRPDECRRLGNAARRAGERFRWRHAAQPIARALGLGSA